MIVPAGHRLRPADLGALLAAGVLEVPVVRKPRVAIIPTGTELAPPTGNPQPGQIIEFNSRVIAGLIEEWGGSPEIRAIIPDDFILVREAIARAAESADLVIINAGSSVGSEDFTAAAIGEVGEALVHGVAIKPGKPVILGLVAGRPVIGLPGYPVSTFLTCHLFVKPLVFRRLGLPAPEPDTVRALLTRRLASTHGVDEFLRVKLGEVGGGLVAVPMPRGAGVITSLVRADGILCIPREAEGLGEGSEVKIALLKERSAIRDTVVVTGSHDITLDLLGSRLAMIQPGRTLSTSNVGSLGGIMAIKRREAHLAGVHLMDEETGEYNVSYVRRYLPGQRAVLCHLARRQQGFLVAPGNPRGINSFRDLARPDVTFVNRQRGAGTRILLDYHLKREGIDPASIKGYEREEFTHLAVAASVAAGSADAGLGVLAAARALGLDFVPVAYEEFELLALEEEYRFEKVQRLIEVLRTPGFRAEVEALGGYDASDMGRETWVE
jgi:putative molybdopterin biosynthesis protein